jgi:RNA polymerase sigma-70 factor (ECF subfamily)
MASGKGRARPRRRVAAAGSDAMDTTRPSLLIRVRDAGDQAAWREFDGIYRPLLLRFAQARGLSAADAEELAQECMAALHRHVQEFEYDPGKGRFKGWLRTMVNNRFRNRLRDRREYQAASGEIQRAAGDSEASPEALFDRVWRQEHLRHCLRLIRGEVEEDTFGAFVAHVMEEKSVEEVCAQFDMTANQVHAVKSRMMKRIRQRMIQILGEDV